MVVIGQDVADYLGRGDDTEFVTLAGKHLVIVSEMVKAYTRGLGFTVDEPNAAIAAVIVSATARLSSNPDGTITVSIDDYQTRKTVFEGFSIAERVILDGYRRKAA
jgi:phenylpyruvate tautomerase PptA (4-oxalocrotonate tautomerase family)